VIAVRAVICLPNCCKIETGRRKPRETSRGDSQ
jgi:hypothetical protein